MKPPGLHVLFDRATSTLTYAVWDPATRDAVVIDPVLNYDPITQLTSNGALRELLHFVTAEKLRVGWILETHAHADHLSSARELRAALPGARWAISARMTEVFNVFHKLWAWPAALKLSALGVDRWLSDGEELVTGSLRVRALATPGHTPACMTFQIGDWLFTGDTLMMPDTGVGRCDFPGGNAGQLYDSIWGKLYALPAHSEVFVGHDYAPNGRPLDYRASLASHRESNIHIRTGTARDEFIRFREARDKTLTAPRLLTPSLDWNLGAHQIVRI